MAHLEAEAMLAIQDHFRPLGEVSYVFHELASDLVHVDVHVIEPTRARPWHVLFTTGMSAPPMRAPKGHPERRYAELMLCLPEGWFGEGGISRWPGPGADPSACWPMLLLGGLARRPHLERLCVVPGCSVGNCLPPPPFDEGVSFDGAVFISPATTPPGFEDACIVGGRCVNLYAVLPLLPAEVELKAGGGGHELIERLEAHQVSELLDVSRPSVV